VDQQDDTTDYSQLVQEIDQKLQKHKQQFNPSDIQNEPQPSVQFYYFTKEPGLRAKTVGLIAIAIGILLILLQGTLFLKIGSALILLGIFMFVVISEKTLSLLYRFMPNTRKNNLSSKRLPTSEKITLVLILWVIIVFFLTINMTYDIFFILIFIGLLILDIMIHDYLPLPLKKRLNFMIFLFLIVYIVIISEKILSITQI
jgi:hypothetical protein